MSLFLTKIKCKKDDKLLGGVGIANAKSIVDVSLMIVNDLKRNVGEDTEIIEVKIKALPE